MVDKGDPFILSNILYCQVKSQLYNWPYWLRFRPFLSPKGGILLQWKKKNMISSKRLDKKFWFSVNMLQFGPLYNTHRVWSIVSDVWPHNRWSTPCPIFPFPSLPQVEDLKKELSFTATISTGISQIIRNIFLSDLWCFHCNCRNVHLWEMSLAYIHNCLPTWFIITKIYHYDSSGFVR